MLVSLFSNTTATTHIYTLSLHDALPIFSGGYVPVGALLMGASVHEAVFDSLEHATSHGSTFAPNDLAMVRSEEHTSELQSHSDLVCRLLLEKKKKNIIHSDGCAVLNITY